MAQKKMYLEGLHPSKPPKCKVKMAVSETCLGSQRTDRMNREILFLYISPLLFASILLGLLTYFIWRHRRVQGAAPLMILSLAAAEWSIAYALELATAESPIAIVMAKLQYLG